MRTDEDVKRVIRYTPTLHPGFPCQDAVKLGIIAELRSYTSKRQPYIFYSHRHTRHYRGYPSACSASSGRMDDYRSIGHREDRITRTRLSH